MKQIQREPMAPWLKDIQIDMVLKRFKMMRHVLAKEGTSCGQGKHAVKRPFISPPCMKASIFICVGSELYKGYY